LEVRGKIPAMNAAGRVRRRLMLSALASLLGPAVVGAQPPKHARVGVLASSTEGNFGPSVKVFIERLAAAGWVEGGNLTLDVRYAGEQYVRLPEQAAELVKLKVDVIAAMGTPATQAAKQATKTIPIVMESLSDVVATGLVSNLARPGGNITGVSGFSPELNGKRLELIREILPRVERVGVLLNRANPATAPVLQATEAAAQQMRMRLHIVDVRQPADVPAAFDAFTRARSEALVLVADPLLFSETARITELAARHRLPAVYEHRGFPEAGGLMSYGPLSGERFQQMAVYVDRILRGSRPGELPFERPTTFELILNLKAARGLGLEIPPALRLRADRVIE
jgi:ABC-type uncharacterized transport system substrate-binding protein